MSSSAKGGGRLPGRFAGFTVSLLDRGDGVAIVENERLVRRRRNTNLSAWPAGDGFVEPHLFDEGREAPLTTFFTDRDHIVRCAIRTGRKYTELMLHFVNEYPHDVVRLRSQREVEEWLRQSLVPAVTG